MPVPLVRIDDDQIVVDRIIWSHHSFFIKFMRRRDDFQRVIWLTLYAGVQFFEFFPDFVHFWASLKKLFELRLHIVPVFLFDVGISA